MADNPKISKIAIGQSLYDLKDPSAVKNITPVTTNVKVVLTHTASLEQSSPGGVYDTLVLGAGLILDNGQQIVDSVDVVTGLNISR